MRYLTLAGSLFLITLFSSCGPSTQEQLEANKNLVREFGAKIDAEEWDALDTLVTADVHRHSLATTRSPEITSLEEFKRNEQSIHIPFPDAHVTYNMMVAEGDMVAAYATFTGTNTGPFGNLPPTGKSVKLKFLPMFRIKDGKIAEIWVEWDNLSVRTQLGLSSTSTSQKGN